MKRILLTFLIFSAAVFIHSQSVHFGTAAVSGDDEFKSYYSDDSTTGQYLGASNSFPAGTVVTITNPGSGEAVSVTIVKRLSQPGLFMVLSPEAGTAISFPDNDVLDVQAVERRVSEEALTNYAEERAFSEDPDVNPSAELAAADSSEASADADVEDVSEAPAETAEVAGSDEPAVDATELAAASENLSESEAEPEAVPPPVETSVNEYIPPVVVDTEGTSFEEGYDPLVLLEGADDSEAEDITEIVDDPLALAEAITGNEALEDIPLPEEFEDASLPETFEPELPGETEEEAEVTSPIIAISPEADKTLESDELDSGLLEPTIDDLLISEPVAAETEPADAGLTDVTVFEPVIGDIPEDVRETIVLLPDSELEQEALDDTSVAEPDVLVPELEKDSGPVVIESDAGTTLADSDEGTLDLSSIAEPDVLIPESGIESEPVVVEPETDISDGEVSEPEILIPDIVIKEDTVETKEKTPEKTADKETAPAIVEDVIVSEPLVEPETLAMTSPAEEPSDNVIYFLTPGDFRPPPSSEEKKDKDKEKEEEKKVEPLRVERTELEYMIVRELRNGGSYLQLGTYSSIDVLYNTIESINDSYPTIVLTLGSEENQLYKLLIGPITRDEKGIVMTRFRSLGYGDAFLYSPH